MLCYNLIIVTLKSVGSNYIILVTIFSNINAYIVTKISIDA